MGNYKIKITTKEGLMIKESCGLLESLSISSQWLKTHEGLEIEVYNSKGAFLYGYKNKKIISQKA